MELNDNERLQEMLLVAEDRLSLVGRIWWYALLIVIVGAAPLYFLANAGFGKLVVANYEIPALIYNPVARQPLQITGQGIFDLGNQDYSAYVKIRNVEYDRGVPSQSYTAEFKTLGGSTITKVNASTFILPASEKLLVLSRFHADQKPEQLIFTLGETHFIHKPPFDFNFELERKTVVNQGGEYVASAGIKNLTPFIVKQINLPMAIYDNKNQIVSVNFTSVNQVLSGETRTFQYTPLPVTTNGNLRLEITPEANIFERDIFQIDQGVPSF